MKVVFKENGFAFQNAQDRAVLEVFEPRVGQVFLRSSLNTVDLVTGAYWLKLASPVNYPLVAFAVTQEIVHTLAWWQQAFFPAHNQNND
jgi:hypothetical protein